MLLSFLAGVILFSLCYWLLTFFLRERFSKWWVRISVCCGYNVLLIVINTWNNALLNSISVFVLFLLIGLFLFEGRLSSRLALSVFAPALEISCEFIVAGLTAVIAGDSLLTTVRTTVSQAAYSYLSASLYCFLVLLIRYYLAVKRKKLGNISFTPSVSVILLPLFTIMALYFLIAVSPSLSNNPTLQLYSMILICGFLFLNVSFVVLDSLAYKINNEETENREMQHQVDMNEQIIRLQSENIDKLEMAAHDYRKTLAAIGAMLRDDGSSHTQTASYIEEALEASKPSKQAYFFESRALTVIVNRFAGRCQESGIRFKAAITYGDLDFITFPDLCTMLINPLENALEAASLSPDSFICLTIRRMNRMLFLEIRNSYKNEVKEKDGNFLSSKRDRSEKHGIGTRNIRRIVEKYHGAVLFSHNQNIFTVNINLPIPKRKNF